ncbi:MAG TPA: hypothetical protein VJL07_02985 [Dehalococcoidia bacterium]|nr:hypothetical protein [Dehalococcoidia bacterium]
MNTPTYSRQSGAALSRNRSSRGYHAPPSGPALKRLLAKAAAVLAACPFEAPRSGIETAMDYLAAREEFMSLLDARAESLLRRESAGPEDAPFEDLMVAAMEAIQERLSERIPVSLHRAG